MNFASLATPYGTGPQAAKWQVSQWSHITVKNRKGMATKSTEITKFISKSCVFCASLWLFPFHRFLPFLLNGIRGFVLSALDPFCKCYRIHKGVRVARLARFEHDAALQHATSRISVIAGPA